MWAIAWPFFLAAWLLLVSVFASFFFGRKGAGTDVGTGRVRLGPVQRGLRWVFFLSIGFGGAILVASLSLWLHWGRLHFRGVSVSAKVLSRSQEYDVEQATQFTRVNYEFEAKVDDQSRHFRREGKLRGVHFMPSGYVDVLHDSTDPSDSRMALESGDARDLLLSLASFLVLGVASLLLSGRSSRAGVDAGSG